MTDLLKLDPGKPEVYPAGNERAVRFAVAGTYLRSCLQHCQRCDLLGPRRRRAPPTQRVDGLRQPSGFVQFSAHKKQTSVAQTSVAQTSVPQNSVPRCSVPRCSVPHPFRSLIAKRVGNHRARRACRSIHSRSHSVTGIATRLPRGFKQEPRAPLRLVDPHLDDCGQFPIHLEKTAGKRMRLCHQKTATAQAQGSGRPVNRKIYKTKAITLPRVPFIFTHASLPRLYAGASRKAGLRGRHSCRSNGRAATVHIGSRAASVREECGYVPSSRESHCTGNRGIWARCLSLDCHTCCTFRRLYLHRFGGPPSEYDLNLRPDSRGVNKISIPG